MFILWNMTFVLSVNIRAIISVIVLWLSGYLWCVMYGVGCLYSVCLHDICLSAPVFCCLSACALIGCRSHCASVGHLPVCLEVTSTRDPLLPSIQRSRVTYIQYLHAGSTIILSFTCNQDSTIIYQVMETSPTRANQ